MMLRKLIREAVENHLNEVDWEGEFSDVKGSCLNPTAVAKWLNDELNRLNVNKFGDKEDSKTRGKKDIIVTRGTIEDVMENGSINLNNFIRNITMEPDTIFDHNPKMEKSDLGRPQLTVNTGLPAIVGIIYDIENKKFYSVPTCPSAGSCQIGCYARKGFYGMDNSKTMKLTRRLNLLFNDPGKYKQMILSAGPEDIVLSPEVTGHDCNFLKDSLARYSSGEVGLKRWKDVWSAGQGVGLIHDSPTIKDLIDRLVSEYRESVLRIQKTI